MVRLTEEGATTITRYEIEPVGSGRFAVMTDWRGDEPTFAVVALAPGPTPADVCLHLRGTYDTWVAAHLAALGRDEEE